MLRKSTFTALLSTAFVSILTPAYAAPIVQLQPGAIRQIGDFTVECLQDPLLTSPYRYAIFARLPSLELTRILRQAGLGSCRMRTLSGGFDFFYSNRFVNGVNVTSGMHPNGIPGFLRDALVSGDCE